MKKTKQSEDERLRSQFEVFRQHDRPISEPTIVYKPGQRVQHGNLRHSVVTEVLEGGKVLKLHEHSVNNNYGKPVESERDAYVSWTDVVPWKDWAQVRPVHQNPMVRFSYFQTTLSSLLYKNVDFDPDYQRGLVWTIADKQELIESVFRDVDIGKFVFRVLPFSPYPAPHCEIVDGKQRLTALIEFFEGRFLWRGRLFRDMHPQDRSHFKNYSVSVCELSERTTRAQVLEAFVKLNTTGRPHDLAHVARVRGMLEKTKE